ncbi:MAG: DUF4037 domain-containing protein [Anaerolineae bacterium]|nr:DUF4037 domain-containing protein [Anaerolineae bacterium]
MIDPIAIAGEVAAQFGRLPQVEAVVLAGSQTAGNAGPTSDLDMYVYLSADLPVLARESIITPRAARAEVNNQFWETGDEWIEAATGIAVDVMYRTPAWIEDQLDRVLVRHEASVGYSTCFWHNVLTSEILDDSTGWFYGLQQRAVQPYPDPLRENIIAKNYPILRSAISSYRHQIEKAVKRGDLVSVNHRVTALLASYFDILFAVNRFPHPGEKRLVQLATARCIKRPEHMAEQVQAVLHASAAGDQPVLDCADALIDSLEQVLRDEGLLTS